MKTICSAALLWVATLLIPVHAFAITEEKISFGGFGMISLYHPDKAPESLALFVSGDGGWQAGVLNMARYLAGQGVLVAGIDAKRFGQYMEASHSQCHYPASDFEELSLMLQRKYRFPVYTKPLLVGYSYGATLVYGLLAQAPANTFMGAIALGFCRDIALKKPLCEGDGLKSHTIKPVNTYYLDAVARVNNPFIVLNGKKDKACPFDASAAFLQKIKGAELVTLAEVGHGFSIADRWLPDFSRAYRRIRSLEMSSGVAQMKKLNEQLPLTVVNAGPSKREEMVFMISGDGGWTDFDQRLAAEFAAKGYPVAGLDAQKYFWKAKTPAETAAAIEEAVKHYQGYFGKKKFLLCGYSFGACVAPFVVSQFKTPIRASLSGLFLLSPDENADFEIHIADMLSLGKKSGPLNVIKELSILKEVRSLCVFGAEEDKDLTLKFVNSHVKVKTIPGGHHYKNDFVRIVSEATGFFAP